MRSTTKARLALIRSARSWFGIGTAMVLTPTSSRPSPRESLERWICEANRRQASFDTEPNSCADCLRIKAQMGEVVRV